MIKIEINDEEIAARLANVAAAVDDMSPLMQDLAEMLLASTQDRMARGEQPDGAPFAPRSPATLANYAAKGFSFGAPLNRSGEMRQQLASQSGADFLTVGSNAIQAAVMQFGASKSSYPHLWGDIPARPYLGLSEDDTTNILAEITEWLANAAGAANQPL